MKPFAFRQRVGDVNWRAVSSVDVERIIDDNKIEELQSIIDDVTFCDVKSSDIKGNTIHSTKKFVHLMQLMLEYLLYCQESQLQLIQDLHKKNHHMKSQNKLIAQKNESAKEDIRIYRRQITMMKESIKNLNVKDKTVEHPPRVFDPLHRDGKSDSSSATAADALNPIIDSMLQHERETRNFVKDIITEQRHSFLSEFEKISKNVQSTERTGGSSLTRQDIERQLQSNMDMILSELRKSQFARQDSVDSNKENMDVMERERKSLREHERKVERREDKVLATEERLSQMEKELHDRTHDLDMRAAAALALDSSSRSGQQAPVAQRSVGVNTPAAEEEAADQPSSAILGDIAVNILRRVFRRGASGKCQYAFMLWKRQVANERWALHESQVFKLTTENSNYLSELGMLQEQNTLLQQQLAAEKEKCLIESARASTLSRQLKECEVARIMTLQTSVDKPQSKQVPKRPEVETEEQMMDVALRRIKNQMVDPDEEVIAEVLSTEIAHKSEEEQEQGGL